MKFHDQVLNCCKKATNEINRIKRTFHSRSPEFLGSMFKLYVRPHLEYCVQVWSPVYSGDVDTIEKVQNRFTRLLRHGNFMSPAERNLALKITDHKTRRLRGDLIYIYKMFDSPLFTESMERRTRGHSRRLVQERTTNNIRKHSFSVRSVIVWNSLPENIVCSEDLDIFKNRLDLYLSQ